MRHPAERVAIPFVLAEQPRLLLGWLALNSTLPEATRAKIGEWVLQYNEKLLRYIDGRYGHMMTHRANELSKIMAEMFSAEITEGYDQASAEMFENLERDIFGGDGD